MRDTLCATLRGMHSATLRATLRVKLQMCIRIKGGGCLQVIDALQSQCDNRQVMSTTKETIISFTAADLSPYLLRAKYAVRGPIISRAQELERAGKRIIWCNIGNPQALGQKPLTYLRQVIALCEYPDLIEKAGHLFPADTLAAARGILGGLKHGVGAYTESKGCLYVRKAIARFIEARDGITSDPETIFLTDGASKAVQAALRLLLATDSDGIMIPAPQYPLYSGGIALLGGHEVRYFLEEDSAWHLTRAALQSAYDAARADGIRIKGICVINPSNPTGSVLPEKQIEMVLDFAQEFGLAVLADEVYQENLYGDKSRFISFAKVVARRGLKLPLFSFHSCSKGYLGECGQRGGYMEVRNLDPQVMQELIKFQSISLCANVAGQVATWCLVNPPRKGDPSFELFMHEKTHILTELAKKARLLEDGLNSIEGIECQPIEGAMYAFPRITLPEGTTDEDYCMSLLEETGICLVPGTGFVQSTGSAHFRTTILPPYEQIADLVGMISDFHKRYLKDAMESKSHIGQGQSPRRAAEEQGQTRI